MPPYLSDLLHPYQPSRMLRSLDTSLLSLVSVPRFCLETFGKRSFSVFGPTVWNSLPLSLRKTQCFSTFKKKLKTHLFEKHLSWCLQVYPSVYVVQLVCVCVCVCVCVQCMCDTLFMWYGSWRAFIWCCEMISPPHWPPPPPPVMCILYVLVCTGTFVLHESDAELTYMYFSHSF